MKRSVSLLLCFFAFIAFTACASEHAYWREAVKMREGVKIRELSLKEPRLMKAWVARIDLKTPGREDEDEVEVEAAVTVSNNSYTEKASIINTQLLFEMLGGKEQFCHCRRGKKTGTRKDCRRDHSSGRRKRGRKKDVYC